MIKDIDIYIRVHAMFAFITINQSCQDRSAQQLLHLNIACTVFNGYPPVKQSAINAQRESARERVRRAQESAYRREAR